MGWWILAGVLLLALVMAWLPVHLRIDAMYDGQLHTRYTLRYAFLHCTWRKRPGSSTDSARRKSRLQRVFSLVRSARMRRFLVRCMHLVSLEGLIVLHAGDAAASALISGGLDAIGRVPPLCRKVRIRVMPDFFRGSTSGQVRCMFRARLGILLIILLAAICLQKREGTYLWNTPLAN